MTGYLADPDRAPALGIDRLLVVVTGAVAASSTPGWLAWLRETTELDLKVVLTRSATRFVTPAALAATSGGEVLLDEWPTDGADAPHVRLATWAQAVVVFPATLHFLGRFALGLADTPALLTLQSTTAPIALAPALPPGAIDGHAYRQHWARLAERPDVILVPARQGTSITTRRTERGSPAPLSDVLTRLVEHLDRSHGPHVAESFGTGLLTTTIHRTPQGHRWTRTPGPLARTDFRTHDTTHPDTTTPGPVRLCPGGHDPRQRDYLVTGPRSLAEALITDGPDNATTDLLAGLGQALTALHDRPGTPTDLTPPPALTRLTRWLDDRADTPAAAAAAPLLRTTMDEPQWQALRSWTAELTARTDLVTVHGAPGLAAVIPETTGAALLIGEDTGTAPRDHDLGYVLGELVELRWRRPDDAKAWQRLVDAFFEGCGRPLDAAVQRAATLRIAVHLHDYTAYVRWDTDEIKRYGAFLAFLTQLPTGD